jgi:hypothetical protein
MPDLARYLVLSGAWVALVLCVRSIVRRSQEQRDQNIERARAQRLEAIGR